MSDLVEKLLAHDPDPSISYMTKLMKEAAEEIKRLKDEKTRLEKLFLEATYWNWLDADARDCIPHHLWDEVSLLIDQGHEAQLERRER